MGDFRRGLGDAFVRFLNGEYERGRWWARILEDSDLFVAIRDNYLNVYYRGNSVLLLQLDGQRLVGKTHYKYLLRDGMKDPYISSVDGKVLLSERNPSLFFLSDISDLRSLKRSSEPYAGEEKSGIHKILRANSNIIDVEIALSQEDSEERWAAQRIDFAALRYMPEGIELVFYEAKHFSNKELRAGRNGVPPVVEQVRKYERLIQRHEKGIRNSYRRVCQNLNALRGIPRVEIVRCAAENEAPLIVSHEPRLVVFGFDDDQKKGMAWSPHRKALLEAFGETRVLLRGNPAGLRRGISPGPHEKARSQALARSTLEGKGRAPAAVNAS